MKGSYFAGVALQGLAEGKFGAAFGAGMLEFVDKDGDVRYSFLYRDVGTPLAHEKPAGFAHRVLVHKEAEAQAA